MLLRGDMDALPVTEDLPLDFVSEHEGLMHACGHDLHVAGLVGAARILHELRDELEGDVVFMFQPGEEGPGGAKPMIDEGLLEAAGRRVDAAYALHVYSSEHPLGTWFGRPGPLMAAADEIKVRVVGEGGHGSQPFRAKDPIPVACEIVVALQTLVTRQFDVFDPVVITVGQVRRRHQGQHHPRRRGLRGDAAQPLGAGARPRWRTRSSGSRPAWPRRTGCAPRSSTCPATR